VTDRRPTTSCGSSGFDAAGGSISGFAELGEDLVLEQVGQIVETGGGVRALGFQHLLADGQGALMDGPGGAQLALVLEQEGQIVETGGGVRVLMPQRGRKRKGLPSRP
jgi:hypothetical protein